MPQHRILPDPPGASPLSIPGRDFPGSAQPLCRGAAPKPLFPAGDFFIPGESLSQEYPRCRTGPVLGSASFEDHPHPRSILFQQHPHPRSVSTPGASSYSRIPVKEPSQCQEHPNPSKIPVTGPSPPQEHPVPRSIPNPGAPNSQEHSQSGSTEFPGAFPVRERPYPGAIPHSPRSHL